MSQCAKSPQEYADMVNLSRAEIVRQAVVDALMWAHAAILADCECEECRSAAAIPGSEAIRVRQGAGDPDRSADDARARMIRAETLRRAAKEVAEARGDGPGSADIAALLVQKAEELEGKP